MSDVVSGPPNMSAYERERWDELQLHWQKKAKQRELLPTPVRNTAQAAAQKTRIAASATGQTIARVTPARVKNTGGAVKDAAGAVKDAAVDVALVPTITSVVHVLELLNEWIVELSDPKVVFRYHHEHGHEITSLEQLRDLDLKELDEYTRGMVIRWRTLGTLEGAGLGALAMIPVPVLGAFAAITLDVLAMHALSNAIATRICYSYGFDPTDPDNFHMIERMVHRAYRNQVPKAGVVKKAGAAFDAAKGRVNWSQKLRDDHRLMAAVEKLLKQTGGGKHVPVKNARMGMPFIAVLTGAGNNAYVLGDVANEARYYAATVFLVQKYGLEPPSNLRHATDLDLGGEGD